MRTISPPKEPQEWKVGCSKCGAVLAYTNSDVDYDRNTLEHTIQCPHCDCVIDVPEKEVHRRRVQPKDTDPRDKLNWGET